MGYFIKGTISLFIGDSNAAIFSKTLQKLPIIENETLAASGDTNFQFSAMLYLAKQTDDNWEVIVVQSLDG
jgi:hypothetical protein